MTKLILFLSVFLSLNIMAGSGDTTIDDDFGSGTDEFDFERFSNENVLALIDQDMEMACGRDGLCTLFSVTQNDSRFTASFNFGQGSPVNGLSKPDSGSVIITDGSNGLYDSQEYWGVTLQYTRGQCTESVKVPNSLYLTMNRYFYDFVDENGNPRKGFDPAKEAMIMFYTTIIKQANGCSAGR